jgi:UDP-N-acetylglucosamine transferase subunit ALG13
MKLFVTVGNALVPFERLLRMVDEAQAHLGWTGICQHGASSLRPRGLVAQATLSKREFEDAMRTADAVVCHAGVGTLWSAIEAGHTPLVVPRRHAFGEVVNDHQLDICRALEQSGRIIVVASADQLEQRMRDVAATAKQRTPLHRDLSRLEPVARALSEIARSAAASPERTPSRLLALLAAMGPSLERLRVRQ